MEDKIVIDGSVLLVRTVALDDVGRLERLFARLSPDRSCSVSSRRPGGCAVPSSSACRRRPRASGGARRAGR